METYATALTYAIPGFVSLIIIEYIASRWADKEIANSMDTIASLSSGMTNILKDLLGLAVVIVSYSWMVQHFALFTIESEVWLYILCFVLVDFAAYWSHRFNHEINLFWNRHIVHHSSEEFNLSCALRQSISAVVGVYFFLYIPLAIIGIPSKIIATIAPLHLFAQFWYHTRLIHRMGFLEYVLVTPSHHRVHHAINPEYIDKNYAAIFIIWDKMFGTFQEEQDDIPPVYGVKKPVRTWNPFIINYQHLFQLCRDAWQTDNWLDKIRIWFMPTGWRPDDVAKKYPIKIIEDVYNFEKYHPKYAKGMKTWSWIQLLIHNVFLYLMLSNINKFSAFGLLIYSIFLAVSIFAYTSLMDGQRLSIMVEIIKVGIGSYLLYSSSVIDMYELGAFVPIYFLGYLIASLVLTIYFNQAEKTLQYRAPVVYAS